MTQRIRDVILVLADGQGEWVDFVGRLFPTPDTSRPEALVGNVIFRKVTSIESLRGVRATGLIVLEGFRYKPHSVEILTEAQRCVHYEQ